MPTSFHFNPIEGEAPTKKGKIVLDKVGTDIEVFLRDKTGKPIPCIGLIGGTKEKPRPLAGLPDGYAIQEDNVAVEYNIPAASGLHQFVYSVMRAQEAVEAEAKKHDLSIAVAASMKFDAKQLRHPQAQKSGCEDDYNVWEQAVNEKVELDKEIRGAGGHIHVSYTIDGKAPKYPEFLPETESLIMALDIVAGVPLSRLDTDTVRKQFYGKAGAFRIKPYGFEWRVPSNWWTQTPEYMAWMYNQVKRAVQMTNHYGPTARSTFLTYKDHVVKAINDNNKDSYNVVSRAFRMELP